MGNGALESQCTTAYSYTSEPDCLAKNVEITPDLTSKSLRYIRDDDSIKCYTEASTSSTVSSYKPNSCASIYIADTNSTSWKYSTTHKCYILSKNISYSKPSSCSSDSGDAESPVETYTVKYDANGGKFTDSFLDDYEFCESNTLCSDIALPVYNVDYTVWYYDSRELIRSGYTFTGWKDHHGKDVQPGDMVWTYTENVTFYAQWNKNETPQVTTYTVKYDANEGSGAPSEQTKEQGKSLNLSTTKPTRTGYTFVNWNTSKDGTGNSYAPGDSYGEDKGVTLFAQWKVNEYKILYQLNGGTDKTKNDTIGNPTTGTYNQEINIKNPNKIITIVGNSNGTGATIGKNVYVNQKFAGWTSKDVDTKNAYYGDNLWSNGSSKVTATKFKNLSVTNGATVTLVANWAETKVTLPTVSKDGYTCHWNTAKDGTAGDFASGDIVIVSDNGDAPSNNGEIKYNLYAICELIKNSDDNTGSDDKPNDNTGSDDNNQNNYDKTDEEINTNNKTGDVLIYIVWSIGIGTLGYSVYYFMRRRSSL